MSDIIGVIEIILDFNGQKYNITNLPLYLKIIKKEI